MRIFDSRRRRDCRAAVLLLAFLGLAPTLPAQEEPSPFDPPVFHYGEGSIEVLEAVRLTLDHDPNLALQEEDAAFQLGVVTELTGAFDWTLQGNLSYQHREQELRDSVIERERQRRADLEEGSQEVCAEADKLRDLIAQLEAAQTDPSVPITADESINSQLRLINALLNQTDDPERRAELEKLQQRVIATELEAARTLLPRVQNTCDELIAARARLGEVPQFEEFDQASVDLSLSKLFRTGLFLEPFVESSLQSTEFVGKRSGFSEPILDENGEPLVSPSGIPLERFVDFGGKNIPDLYTTRVGFDLSMPLLRGRGRGSVAAPEEAATIDLEATALALKHGASVSVLETVLAYWDLLAAQQRLRILEGSLELQRQLVEMTNTLIEADELPRAEQSRVLASEASAASQADSTREALVAARMQLARTMGVDVETMENSPRAAGPFPEPPATLTGLEAEALIQEALDRRFDVLSQNALVESGLVLAQAAEIDLRSRLDLSGGIWAVARGEDSFSNSTDRWRAPSWSLALSYEKPFGNNTREGILMQREAQLRQRQISATDLERVVGIGVVRTLESLRNALDRLERARESADHFEETIDAEMEKLRYGESTLIDSILTEQQRTGALLDLVGARREVATLIVQLRFETGTLVSQPEEGPAEVTMASLTTLPEANR